MQTNFQVVRMKQKECVRVHARIPYKYAIGNARQLIMSDDCVTQAGRFELHAFDLSKGGIGVITKSDIPNGTFLMFDIGIEEIKYTVMGLVKWKASNEFTHRYGIEFVGTGNMLYRHIDALSKNQSFFDKVVEKREERRRHERRDVQQEVVCTEIFRDGNPEGERVTNRVMQIVDLSFQGARLNSSQKLAAGAVVSMQFVRQGQVVAFKGKIIWSKYTLKGVSGMKYASGVEFVGLTVENLYSLRSMLG